MIDEILNDLKVYALNRTLDDKQKKNRKELSYKLLEKVKMALFQLFYEDFFAYSSWNVGYPKNGIYYQLKIQIIQHI